MKDLYPTIKRLVENGSLSEPFSNASINQISTILKKSHSFLSKHCKGAPNNYNKFFERVGQSGSGLYRLIRNN